MTIFISGGVKNGKSSLAQELAVKLGADGHRYYVATMIPRDEEDEARIRRHVADRAGLGFRTIECGQNIGACREMADAEGTYLIDSVTALLQNEFFVPPQDGRVDSTVPARKAVSPRFETDSAAPARCASELTGLLGLVKHAVIVSDYIYSDAALYDETTEAFRRGLAFIDRALAAACDTVVEVSAGIPIVHKGVLPR